MPRQLTPFSSAVRELLEKNPKITHKEARPLLEAMGVPIAKECSKKSHLLGLFEQAEERTGSVEKAKAEMNLSANKLSILQKELDTREAFRDEANNFNTTKNYWAQRSQPSFKPEVKNLDQLVVKLRKIGGLESARKQIKSIDDKIAQLQAEKVEIASVVDQWNKQVSGVA